MQRRFAIVLLLLTSTLHAEPPVRTVAARGDVDLLTKAQQIWLAQFEQEAIPSDDQASWLDRSAGTARDAGLGATADYLATAARVLRGDAKDEDAERSLRRTLGSPLLLIIRFDQTRIGDVIVATCDPARTQSIESSIEQFAKGQPQFEESWIDRSPSRAITRVANLHFRAGANAAAASTGTYLPFDRALTPSVGRTWIVYDNMIRANWWGEGVRPVALRLLPADAKNATAEALIAWYGVRAPIYQIGAATTRADRERLGTARDPISIIRGDLLPVLVNGSTNEQIASLVAVSFHTLRDLLHNDAPPAHLPATMAELNWLIDRGGLRFDAASVTWTIDYERCRSAIRDLATEVMAIEKAGDAKRAQTLFANDAKPTASIEKSVAAIDTIPLIKVAPLFVP